MTSESSGSQSNAIDVLGLEKTFGEQPAIREIDLTVSPGECLVIFGPNGAGKTTLLKILSTIMKPSAGSVYLKGIDIRSNPTEARRKLSLVSHQTFLYNDLTVLENLKFYGKMYDVENLEKRIRDAVSWVQLESRLYDRVGTLSRGLQQRASIARAVLHNPSIILLDEPEVGLDPLSRRLIKDSLSIFSTEKRTAIMTTHDLAKGLEIADTVIILDRGMVVYKSPVNEIDKADFSKIYSQFTTVLK